MAGFRMHVGTSTVLGCGYAGVLAAGYGVPVNTAIVSGAMCGFSGMLPDLDSDYGVPLRETMAFSAATIPMMLVSRFQAMGLGIDAMALATVGMYLFVRFGVTKMIRKFTVHRGMFHSIPAMLIFGGLAFLICGGSPLDLRCYKAGGVMGGFLSHLILDEIYAVEFQSGRWRLKKSFGTAMKLWGDNRWSNVAAYSKLALVGLTIVGEPSVMQRLAVNNPQLASQLSGLRSQLQSAAPNGLPQNGTDMARAALNFFNNAGPNSGPNAANNGGFPPYAAAPQQFGSGGPAGNQPSQWQWPAATTSNYGGSGPPMNYENGYNTALRPTGPAAQ
jgi:LexA-binding, inner membrane-associated putative hydrolase